MELLEDRTAPAGLLLVENISLPAEPLMEGGGNQQTLKLSLLDYPDGAVTVRAVPDAKLSVGNGLGVSADFQFAGEVLQRQLAVTAPFDDAVFQFQEGVITFTVVQSTATNFPVGEATSFQIAILDNDTPAELVILPVPDEVSLVTSDPVKIDVLANDQVHDLGTTPPTISSLLSKFEKEQLQLAISAVPPPLLHGGAVAVNPDKTITYTPPAGGLSEPAIFQYRVSDVNNIYVGLGAVRVMPNVEAVALVGGELKIAAGSEALNIVVERVWVEVEEDEYEIWIRVTNHGAEIARYLAAEVQHITFLGSEFADRFQNITGIPATVEGKGGDDTLIGGWGDGIYVFSGAVALGTDTIYDSQGANTLDFSGLAGDAKGKGVTVNLRRTRNAVTSAGGLVTANLGKGHSVVNVVGTAFDDTIYGNDLDNYIDGRDGDDYLAAFGGNDTILGGDGVDTVYGGKGNDWLEAGPGRDFLIGGDGNDTLVAGPGGGSLYGDRHNDTYVFAGDSALGHFVIYDHHGSSDTLNFEGLGAAIELDLAKKAAALASPLLSLDLHYANSIENVTGTFYDDVIYGNNKANRLNGVAGTDQLIGRQGNDTYAFHNQYVIQLDNGWSQSAPRSIGEVTIVEEPKGGAYDTFDFGPNTIDRTTWSMSDGVTISLAKADQEVNWSLRLKMTPETIERVFGTSQNDKIYGSSYVNYLNGGAGDDWLEGFAGNDTLVGGPGADTYAFGDQFGDGNSFGAVYHLGTDTIFEDPEPGVADTLVFADHSDGNNVYWMSNAINVDLQNAKKQVINRQLSLVLSSADIENVVGTEFADVITGNILNNKLEGRGEADRLEGGYGNDLLVGGYGADRYVFDNAFAAFLAARRPTLGDIANLGADRIDETEEDSADTLDFSAMASQIRIDLSSTENQWLNSALQIQLLNGASIENVIGTSSHDYIAGNSLNNRLEGGRGADTLYGRGGEDTLLGGEGNDGLYGGFGFIGDSPIRDTLNGGPGADRFLDVRYGYGTNFANIVNTEPIDATVSFVNPIGNWRNDLGQHPMYPVQPETWLSFEFVDGLWTDAMIEHADKALAEFHNSTGNTRLLNGRTRIGDDPYDDIWIEYYDHQDKSGEYTDRLEDITSFLIHPYYDAAAHPNERNEDTRDTPGKFGLVGSVSLQEIYRQIAYVWIDNEMGLDRYEAWKSLSGWSHEGGPGRSKGTSKAADWYYASDASFITSIGRLDPDEDFAEAFAAYFLGDDLFVTSNPPGRAIDLVPAKRDFIKDLLSSIASGANLGDSRIPEVNRKTSALYGLYPVGNTTLSYHRVVRNKVLELGPGWAHLPISYTVSYVTNQDSRGRYQNYVRVTGKHGIWEIPGESFPADKIETIHFWGSKVNDYLDVTGVPVPVEAHGNDGNDMLLGGLKNDLLIGGFGNDTIYGNGGNDYIYGEFPPESKVTNIWNVVSRGLHMPKAYSELLRDGQVPEMQALLDNQKGWLSALPQNPEDVPYYVGSRGYVPLPHSDDLHGGEGNDHIYGGIGLDRIFGDRGHDWMYGEDHADLIFGGSGNDNLYGDWDDETNDLLRALANISLFGFRPVDFRPGNDWLYGEGDGDKLFGGYGNDSLHGQDGGDQLLGGHDNDFLDGGRDRIKDTLAGGDGMDLFFQHIQLINGNWEDEDHIYDPHADAGDFIERS